MKKEIKNVTIFKNIVRRKNAKILKQVQDDMVVQGDMEVYGHCERMRSNPANYLARSADKVFSPFTFHLSPKDTLTSHLSPSHFSRKSAFTLAEVLITLGIIGVVAAMTMPTLIAKYQKKVFATKVKQTYAILSNALTSSIAANGTPAEWSYGATSDEVSTGSKEDLTYIVNTYFKPYLKVAEDIGYKSLGYHIVLSNGTTLSFFTDGDSTNGIYTPTTIYILASNNKNTKVYWDASRDYSQHDIFYTIYKDHHKFLNLFCWRCSEDVKRDDIKNDNSYGCNKNIAKNDRYNCGALIMNDGWEIKDDYPW